MLTCFVDCFCLLVQYWDFSWLKVPLEAKMNQQWSRCELLFIRIHHHFKFISEIDKCNSVCKYLFMCCCEQQLVVNVLEDCWFMVLIHVNFDASHEFGEHLRYWAETKRTGCVFVLDARVKDSSLDKERRGWRNPVRLDSSLWWSFFVIEYSSSLLELVLFPNLVCS